MYKVMAENKDVFFVFIDLGFPRVDEFLEKYPDRTINCGASEATACDIAVGLSYAKKIPVLYTITPFYWRAAETIRTYLDYEKLPCLLVGVGVKEEYGEDGFSHSGTDAPKLFNLFKNFKQFYPDTPNELISNLNEAIISNKPNFLNLHR